MGVTRSAPGPDNGWSVTLREIEAVPNLLNGAVADRERIGSRRFAANLTGRCNQNTSKATQLQRKECHDSQP
jgi:hypothetical protein